MIIKLFRVFYKVIVLKIIKQFERENVKVLKRMDRL